MITFTRHDSATCPNCGEPLVYGTKEEAASWKVYYECSDRCGWERMAGRIGLAEVEHRDEVGKQAEEMGNRWS